MSNAAAWVMKVNDSMYASVSQMELVHIVNGPEPVSIPRAPSYCKNIIVWNDNILPVVDLASMFGISCNNDKYDVVAVTIYRDGSDKINYGGLRLFDSPELEDVENGQVCNIPEFPQCLRSISLSCFISKNGYEVPILDMGKVFSRGLSLELS